jgi:hypothetical protein
MVTSKHTLCRTLIKDADDSAGMLERCKYAWLACYKSRVSSSRFVPFSIWSSRSFTSVQLLSVLGIGFLQGLYALDAADGSSEDPSVVCPTFPLLSPI